MDQALFMFHFIFLKKILFIFREKGREGERERNSSVWLPFVCPLLGTWSSTQACALTGNRTGNISAHRLAPKSLSHTSQGSFHLLQTSLPVSTAVHSHLFNDNLPLLYSNLWKAAIFQKYFIIVYPHISI